MKCPYCGEEIMLDAILCRHCNRDLNFLAPVMTRLKAIEEKLDGLADRVKRLERHAAPVPRAAAASVDQSRSVAPFVVAAAAAGIITGLANYARWTFDPGMDVFLGLVFLGTGPFTALILGMLRQHRRTLGSVIIGLAVGAAYAISEEIAIFVTLEEVAVGLAGAVVIAVPSGWFGGWLGDVIIRRIGSPFRSVRTALTRGAAADAEPGQRPPLSERLARLAEAVTPLVTATVPIVMIILQLLYGLPLNSKGEEAGVLERGTAPVEEVTEQGGQ